jgi:hypothetical protein
MLVFDVLIKAIVPSRNVALTQRTKILFLKEFFLFSLESFKFCFKAVLSACNIRSWLNSLFDPFTISLKSITLICLILNLISQEILLCLLVIILLRFFWKWSQNLANFILWFFGTFTLMISKLWLYVDK